MILLDSRKNVYRVTFHREAVNLILRDETVPGMTQTSCILSGKDRTFVGSTIKSPKDAFDGYLANKTAFRRALDLYTQDRQLRGELWSSFLRGGVSRKEAGIIAAPAKEATS